MSHTFSSRSPARPPPPARLAARGPPAPISKHDNNRDAGNNNYHQPNDGAPPEGQRSAPRTTADPRDPREPTFVLRVLRHTDPPSPLNRGPPSRFTATPARPGALSQSLTADRALGRPEARLGARPQPLRAALRTPAAHRPASRGARPAQGHPRRRAAEEACRPQGRGNARRPPRPLAPDLRRLSPGFEGDAAPRRNGGGARALPMQPAAAFPGPRGPGGKAAAAHGLWTAHAVTCRQSPPSLCELRENVAPADRMLLKLQRQLGGHRSSPARVSALSRRCS
ncbi:hypothetical protein NN561_015228 [Cricetulus griseus]